jgi:hypothetical protein
MHLLYKNRGADEQIGGRGNHAGHLTVITAGRRWCAGGGGGGDPIPAAASTDVLNSLYSLGRVEEEKRTRLYIFFHRYNLVLFY